ncbi:SCO2400 family protein [Streptomyces xantholiticus]|uniref:SCO2400 family protein n=1 Tax=Streptomyces xantholiticus TaxID=68285 RepID=UPI0016728B06|nr:hypothetical protein [Streptomyces xantholiticus]GGW27328.1 hypothetical protein GCM10010381_09460 [Streptomyces xantholiticus]
MDYCHPCGRHLNGALACAGCGTPVEELRHHSPSAAEPERVYELDVTPEPADNPGPRRARRQAATRRKPAGRRARKRRGRKVLIGAVGLVLAAGALSLAELAMEGPGDDGAATAVREKPVAESTAPEPTASDEAPDAPDDVQEPAVTKSASPRPRKPRAGTGDGRGAEGEGPDGEGGGTEPSASGSAGDGDPSPSSSGDPEGPGDPSGTGEPPADPGDPESPGQQDPPPPPEPEPTETCERFLFWCV